jgi:Exo-beta-D-glucosaminidase Ig-fold domain/Glycosyl hydrolases family 2/Glycosyl hydrolases family 2, sugar binding domain/Glycosyl hydrolases family 2, TIM barrel domain
MWQMNVRFFGLVLGVLVGAGAMMPGGLAWAASAAVPQPMTIGAGWQLQDATKVSDGGAVIATEKYKPQGWRAATVPGTVLTSLVNDGVYPEPMYGENNRPDKIPDSLSRTPFWYRTVVKVPKEYKDRQVWLNFEGINFSAQVWVNGQQVGTMKGAFARGIFDVTPMVKAGKKMALAVLVSPQPHPGTPHEHTIRDGVGKNGGITAIDGPTFLSTIGWDWLPAIRDRDSGIWQKVFLSASGPVVIKDPLVTTDLPLPKTDAADVAVQARVENVTDAPQKGVLKGSFGDVTFEQSVEVAPHSSQVVKFDPATTAALHVMNPKLWWPNGYGPQNLYDLHLSFEIEKQVSDSREVRFGIRKITYSVPDSENLTISVNGVRVFVRGGNWGLDEAMKRNPRERLEAQIRLHQLANMNMIRNWVGQSTSEDFYELCDQYGMLVWDEFFQPNPSDGPDPDDFDTYMVNVRDKILRFRNHPSIALWCARNEGNPPKRIDDALRVLMTELEPTRLYQANSADGRGVHSGGPYHWRTPREFYVFDEAFKSEIGSMSVPTIESVRGMMPEKDWETINDDWAEHDFAKGAQQGDKYPGMIASRYGKVTNLADFVRKAQLANYEAFRAMYEGRNAKLFAPTTGIMTWMSNPAQPSFTWQIYHHDLEPNSALFAVKKAAEMVHVQMNESTGDVEVINNLPTAVGGAKVRATVYGLDGTVAWQKDFDVEAAGSAATKVGEMAWPEKLSAVHFVKLELRDSAGKMVSENFYWRAQPEHQDDLTALGDMPVVKLEAKVARRDVGGRSFFDVTLTNPGTQIALMAHVQLRGKKSGERVLPIYASDNYVSLIGGETKTITLDAAAVDLKGEDGLAVVDGWNVGLTDASLSGGGVALNVGAQVEHGPVTGLPMISLTQ